MNNTNQNSSTPSKLLSTKLKSLSFVFFGTNPLADHVLNTLEKAGFTPSLIVTTKDTVDKKGNVISPTEKKWAKDREIKTIEPEKLTPDVLEKLSKEAWDVFIVASYGKILPKKLLEIPKFGVLNLHPSLLPILRGPSPMRSAILEDRKETGVSIMLLDAEMDHGPIIAQKKITIEPWPQKGNAVDNILAEEGANLLTEVLPKWVNGEIEAKEQNHNNATFCKEFTKQDGEIKLSDDPYQNFLKFSAYEGWPGTFFFHKHKERDIRVKITDAEFKNNEFKIKRVIPEGKKEMSYEEFLRGYTEKA